jgi:hypothetical protein
LFALTPAGAWIVARRRTANGSDCCNRTALIGALLLAASLVAACIGTFLFAFALPDTFRPICTVLEASWSL